MKWLPVGVLGVLLLFIFGFFVKNNLLEKNNSNQDSSKLFLQGIEGDDGTVESVKNNSTNLPTIKESLQSPPSPVTAFGYPSQELICPLRDEPVLFVRLQLEYRYSEVKLRDELKLKNPELNAIVQNVVYMATRSQLNAPWLRSKIIEVSNQILTTGKLEDIIFKNFKIEIRNKKSDTQ